ncbi:single-stranded DNA-binding protein [Mucilaginibacter corticis]|uniref:Single-stranded DNA-binding protein n=1 Tax=Mucilaginibacter corticis TaxID=2597670 RepID=A0A556M8V6_9SPHI|nr:single-stranded DNA-binding protein [Mucilaginibacter corticis]TSJ36323.1 single-stranded DNA-binding protein [Mucilaginibacter corticis]
MSGINKVILIGHLGKDPELKETEGGVSLVMFTLATTEYIGKHGSRHEQTEWHNIVMWRSVAERAMKLLKKGILIHIAGKCKTRSITDSSGTHQYITEIIAESFTLLGRPNDFMADALVTDGPKITPTIIS